MHKPKNPNPVFVVISYCYSLKPVFWILFTPGWGSGHWDRRRSKTMTGHRQNERSCQQGFTGVTVIHLNVCVCKWKSIHCVDMCTRSADEWKALEFWPSKFCSILLYLQRFQWRLWINKGTRNPGTAFHRCSSIFLMQQLCNKVQFRDIWFFQSNYFDKANIHLIPSSTLNKLGKCDLVLSYTIW